MNKPPIFILKSLQNPTVIISNPDLPLHLITSPRELGVQYFHSFAGSLGADKVVASRKAPQTLGLTWYELPAAEPDTGLVGILLKPERAEYGTPEITARALKFSLAWTCFIVSKTKVLSQTIYFALDFPKDSKWMQTVSQETRLFSSKTVLLAAAPYHLLKN